MDYITIAVIVNITIAVTIATFGVLFSIVTARRRNNVTIILTGPLGLKFQRKMEDHKSTRALVDGNSGVVDFLRAGDGATTRSSGQEIALVVG